MKTRDIAAQWVSGYVKAWTTNDPDDIAALFIPDAVPPSTAPALAGASAHRDNTDPTTLKPRPGRERSISPMLSAAQG